MWLTHFWHSRSQFFIFAWDVTAGGILRTGVLICLVLFTIVLYVCYILWNDFYVYVIVHMIMNMLLLATSTHFKWKLMLYYLHCPTLNTVFLFWLLLCTVTYLNVKNVLPLVWLKSIANKAINSHCPPRHLISTGWKWLREKKYVKDSN